MSAIEPTTAFFYEGTSLVWLSRVEGKDGVAIQQADVATIAFSVRDRNKTAVEHSAGALTVADVVFDTLQLDVIWTFDKTGYNFKWQLTATELDQLNRQEYLVEVVFTMADTSKVAIVAHLDQVALGSL